MVCTNKGIIVERDQGHVRDITPKLHGRHPW